MGRGIFALGAGLVTLLVASSASADTAACIQTEDLGNRARDVGRLLDARAHFRWCSAEACPTEVRDACAHAVKETEERIPSILVEAKDDDHRVVKDAHVIVDNLEISSVTDECELMVDPGERVIRIERTGYLPVTMRVNVQEGSHGIPVRVALVRPRYDITEPPHALAIAERPRAQSPNRALGFALSAAGIGMLSAGL